MKTTTSPNEQALNVDFDAVRSDFPVLQREVNGRPLVYLDNAASSQMPKPVIDRLNAYHSGEHANVHRGIHTLSQQATDAFEATREKVSNFINSADKHEVIYTSGTTDSINLVASSFGRQYLSEGDEILISEMEHHSNIVPWQLIAEQTGAKIKVIPFSDEGLLDLEQFEELLSERTKIVGVVHVSNALGTINPIKKMVSMAHEHDVPVLVDGAQAAPHIRVDVQDLDCDFYAFSAHKMCGPTGFGILYGKMKWLEQMPPYRGGGEMIDKVTFEETTFEDPPFKFEAGTPAIAEAIGLGSAIDYLNELGMEHIAEREGELLEYATERLQQVDGLKIIGNAAEKSAVISFVFDDIHAHDVGTILNEQGIAIRTGHHCAQPVMQHYNVPATARASFSFYNNKKDVDRLVEGLQQVLEIFG